MNKKLLISLFSIILFRVCAFSQSITNIDPANAVPGDAITVSLVGVGTHFSQSGANATTFDFGSNVTIGLQPIKRFCIYKGKQFSPSREYNYHFKNRK